MRQKVALLFLPSSPLQWGLWTPDLLISTSSRCELYQLSYRCCDFNSNQKLNSTKSFSFLKCFIFEFFWVFLLIVGGSKHNENRSLIWHKFCVMRKFQKLIVVMRSVLFQYNLENISSWFFVLLLIPFREGARTHTHMSFAIAHLANSWHLCSVRDKSDFD